MELWLSNMWCLIIFQNGEPVFPTSNTVILKKFHHKNVRECCCFLGIWESHSSVNMINYTRRSSHFVTYWDSWNNPTCSWLITIFIHSWIQFHILTSILVSDRGLQIAKLWELHSFPSFLMLWSGFNDVGVLFLEGELTWPLICLGWLPGFRGISLTNYFQNSFRSIDLCRFLIYEIISATHVFLENDIFHWFSNSFKSEIMYVVHIL